MNYRKKIEQTYNIKLSNKYVVHHIDFDRANNDINNLMILPRKLHGRYHFIVEGLMKNKNLKNYERKIDIRITSNHCMSNLYQFYMIERVEEVLDECSKWADYKFFLEGVLPNVHGIELEEN